MIAGLVSALASCAALSGAPLLASAADDVVLVAVVIGAAAVIAVAVSVVGPRLARERHHGTPPGGVERRAVRSAGAGLAEDPIVAALGLGDDEALRARRRRRPVGGHLNSPPGDSPPPS
jgi:hypothetical protein